MYTRKRIVAAPRCRLFGVHRFPEASTALDPSLDLMNRRSGQRRPNRMPASGCRPGPDAAKFGDVRDGQCLVFHQLVGPSVGGRIHRNPIWLTS